MVNHTVKQVDFSFDVVTLKGTTENRKMSSLRNHKFVKRHQNLMRLWSEKRLKKLSWNT